MTNIDWRKTGLYLGAFLALLAIMTWLTRPAPEQTSFPENPATRQTLDFDGRSWESIRTITQGDKLSIEFVPQGQSTETWQEKLTLQTFHKMQEQGSMEDFAGSIEKNLRDFAGSHLTWQLWSTDTNNLFYCWQIKGQENFRDQYELCRITQDGENFHLFHYASRLQPMPTDQQQRHWQQLLSQLAPWKF